MSHFNHLPPFTDEFFMSITYMYKQIDESGQE